MTRRLVVFGLSLSSAWGNGHATTYRGLLAALAAAGWQITFFERDVEWYRAHRDLTKPTYCDLRLYDDWPGLRAAAEPAVRAADAVLVGSYAGCAIEIVDWLAGRDLPRFFYDIDTPVTLTALRDTGVAEYLRADQIPQFDCYFSFTGGPALRELEQGWGARRAVALYCGVDPAAYRPVETDPRYACCLGYMGTYAPDRQPKLEELLIEPARGLPEQRFLVAGAQYPALDLPANVATISHIFPVDHAAFYSSNGATLNLTRQAMVRYGWSPSVRLFEAAACGACIISDRWAGLEELLQPGKEVLLADDRRAVRHALIELGPEQRRAIGAAARRRVLAEHTYAQRAAQFAAVYEQVVASTTVNDASEDVARTGRSWRYGDG